MSTETITFYSYKGGTGRSLVVSHVANYLAGFGKNVVAIDFDLEAPGLHYKLGLHTDSKPAAPDRGLLDLLFDSLKQGAALPASLDGFAPIVVRDESGGSVRLLGAGNSQSNEYWGRLAQINWHDAFYAPDALGIPLFLELVRRLESEFAPDYILIDSRTGVTEIGGVATSILPDRLVCLFTNSLESLEGTRNVIRSVAVAPRLRSDHRIDVIPILTRIPEIDKDTEARITSSALAYLNERDERTEAPRLEEIFVLHSEPSLQVREKLLTTRDATEAEQPLLRDYLRLFSRLVPPEVVEPYIDRLVENVLRRVIDDPDGVQKDLETLARLYPHRASLRALVKFYRLRKAAPEVILKTATRLFAMTGDLQDGLLSEIVTTHLKNQKLDSKDLVELVDAVWRETHDAELGFALVGAHGKRAYARKVLLTILDLQKLTSMQIINLAGHAARHRLTDEFLARAPRFVQEHATEPRFVADIVRLFGEWRSPAEAHEFMRTASIDSNVIVHLDPALGLRIARRAGDIDMGDRILREAIRRFVGADDEDALVRLGASYLEDGEIRMFEKALRSFATDAQADRIINQLARAMRPQ